MKDWLMRIAILGGPILLGGLVSLCGIFLSLGFKKKSVFCFFCTLLLLVLMRFAGWFVGKRGKN